MPEYNELKVALIMECLDTESQALLLYFDILIMFMEIKGRWHEADDVQFVNIIEKLYEVALVTPPGKKIHLGQKFQAHVKATTIRYVL